LPVRDPADRRRYGEWRGAPGRTSAVVRELNHWFIGSLSPLGPLKTAAASRAAFPKSWLSKRVDDLLTRFQIGAC
jgi:hypothetical protein